MVREGKATEFIELKPEVKSKFLEDSIFHDAGISE